MVHNAEKHSGKKDRGYCYVWVEGEGGRGSKEVGSCILKHIQITYPQLKHLTLSSDSCGGSE